MKVREEKEDAKEEGDTEVEEEAEVKLSMLSTFYHDAVAPLSLLLGLPVLACSSQWL